MVIWGEGLKHPLFGAQEGEVETTPLVPPATPGALDPFPGGETWVIGEGAAQ